MAWGEVPGKGKSRGSPRDNHSAGLFQAEDVVLTIFQSNTVNSQHPQFLAQTLDYTNWKLLDSVSVR